MRQEKTSSTSTKQSDAHTYIHAHQTLKYRLTTHCCVALQAALRLRRRGRAATMAGAVTGRCCALPVQERQTEVLLAPVFLQFWLLCQAKQYKYYGTTALGLSTELKSNKKGTSLCEETFLALFVYTYAIVAILLWLSSRPSESFGRELGSYLRRISVLTYPNTCRVKPEMISRCVHSTRTSGIKSGFQ